MTCVVIDDEPVAIDILMDYIAKVPFLELVGTFRSAIKAMTHLQEEEVDLIFLDINMPDLSGIQFLKSLHHPPLVIFSTAYSEYALESYDYDAVDYLLKPIEFDRFLKAVNRASSRFLTSRSDITTGSPTLVKDEDQSILIKSGTELHRMNIGDILYIKGTGNYVTFVTDKKEIMALMTMKEALGLLPRNLFFRIHKSYIINFYRVDLIEKDRVKIHDKKIPIGEVYRDGFLRAIPK